VPDQPAAETNVMWTRNNLRPLLGLAIFAAVVSPSAATRGTGQEAGATIDSAARNAAIVSAGDAAGWPGLHALCSIAPRAEMRLWLLGETVVNHAVRLFGRTTSRPYEGEAVSFKVPEGSRLLYVNRIYDDRHFNWSAWIAAVANWENLRSDYRDIGNESGMGLYVESCSEGAYETRWHPFEPANAEGRILTGFVIDAISDLE
jgi:hypothetical protein